MSKTASVAILALSTIGLSVLTNFIVEPVQGWLSGLLGQYFWVGVGIAVCACAVLPFLVQPGGQKSKGESRAKLSPLSPDVRLAPAVKQFVGRRAEIARLRQILSQEPFRAEIVGMPGVGKTVLAIKVASELGDIYPHEPLEIDLHGLDEPGQTTIEALRKVLRRLDVELPEGSTEHELSGVYVAALEGQKRVIIIHQPASATQLDHFAPPAGCCLLITSREHRLAPQESVYLAPLAPEEAQRLLRMRVSHLTSTVVEQICEVYENLPQAIVWASDLFVRQPDVDPQEYVRQVKVERERLRRLSDLEVDEKLETAFTLTYRLLDSEVQRVFRRLSVFVDAFDRRGALLVAGKQDDQQRISNLVTWSLLAFDEQQRLYQLSELVRLFATAQPDFNNAEYEAAMQGYADYAIELSRSSGWKLPWQTSGGISAIPLDIDRYRAHIQTALKWMIGPDRNHLHDPERIIMLIDSPFGVVMPHLTLNQIKDWYDVAHQALETSDNYSSDDKSRIISNMAAKLWKSNEEDISVMYANEAVELARAARPKGSIREAIALHNLGLTQFRAKSFAAANENLKLAEKAFRKFNHRRNAAHSLLALYALNRQWGVMPNTVIDAYYRDARDLMNNRERFLEVLEQVDTQGLNALVAFIDISETFAV